jgi:hypothetical protein
MATLENVRFRVSAIGGTSFTLVPILGQGSAGALVDGFPGGTDLASGVTSIVVNSTGAPDTNFARHVNQIMILAIDTEN